MKRCMGCMEQMPDEISVCPKCGYDESVTEEKLDVLRIGSRLGNRYVVGKTLGRGGFGITYIAWDEKLQRKVAVKEYMPRGLSAREPGSSTVRSDTEQQGNFENGIRKTIEESRKLAGLSKLDSVVNVFDFFEENGTAYIVMELLEGKNVKQYLQEKGKIGFEETMRIITPILKTLSTVHKNGLIHRDISPDNIFLCDDGKMKLLDFGAARVAEDADERSRSIVLKHGYAPMEQYSSRGKQGTYSDMYAVAATIYKMLTGITPQESIERLTGGDELQDISELVDIPKQAAYAIMQGLELKEKDRIQTADEFLEKLTEKEKPVYAGDETVTMTAEAVKQKYGDILERAEQNDKETVTEKKAVIIQDVAPVIAPEAPNPVAEVKPVQAVTDDASKKIKHEKKASPKKQKAKKEKVKSDKNAGLKKKIKKIILIVVAVPVALLILLLIISSISSNATRKRYQKRLNSISEITQEVTQETTQEEAAVEDRSNEPEYLAAKEAFHKKVYAEKAEYNEEDGLQAYFVDINGDGYKDIVYNAFWFPSLAIYKDGEFVVVDIESEVVGGSLFPSGRNSGYFVDSDNGIIIVRYGGHTQGTAFYNGAQAFKINGTVAESLWVIYSDEEKYYSENMSEDERDKAVEKCFEDFEKSYRQKTEDYYLVDYFDACINWTA